MTASDAVTFNTASNTLTVIDGGRMTFSNNIVSIMRNLSSYHTIRVSGEGSRLDGGGNAFNLTYWASGSGHTGNQVIVANDGVLTNMLLRMHIQNNSAPVCQANRVAVTNGGRFYSAGAFSFNDNAASPNVCNNTALVAGVNSVWDNGNYNFSTSSGSNHVALVNGGLLTNVAALTLAKGNGNALIVTNGGRVFVAGTATFGNIAADSNNTALVTGSNSLWHLGNTNLTIGLASSLNNALTIDQGGTVDAIAKLTVAGARNSVNLRGGTLGVANTTYTNDLFMAGDGTQSTTLKALGGTLSFVGGLQFSSNAWLTGIGMVDGGTVGVTLTNGATLSPGLAGVGSLTIGGSNLTWNAGATYLCEVTNFASSAGMGYDTINVSSQLALVADVGSSSLVIRLSSLGVPAANFSPNASYNLLVASCGSLTGYDPTQFTVNTNDFLNPPAGVWGVMGLDNNLYVTYRPTVDSGLAYTWAAPSNGNWTVDGNWVGGVSPSANSPGMQLTFGGGTSDPAYYATNNNSGQFQLNRLTLTNANATATNYLMGNPLEFWNAGARIEQGGDGPFVVSNNVNLKLDLILGGNGAGTLTLASNITGVGTLTKQGASTVALNASNNFSGLVIVDGPGGILRIGHTNAFGTNSFVVNNGMLWITNNFTVGYGFYRAARVSGSGSIWSNSLALTLGPNGLIAVEGGGRLACGALTLASEGGANSGFGVTNGGQLYTTGAAQIGNARSNSTLTVGGGGSIWNAGSQALTVGTGTATGNVLRIDGQAVAGGAVVTNTSTLDVGKNSGANGNELQVVAGGRLFTSGATVVGTSSTGNTVRVEGAGSLWNASATAITIGSGAGAQSNRLVIDGNGISGGAVVSNINAFKVGNVASANATVITNGGFLHVGAGDLVIGNAGFSNTLVVVGGAGAVSMIEAGSQIIRVGYVNGSNNTVLVDGRGVEGGAVITNGGVLVFGDGSLTPALQNRLIVTNGGVLYIGGARIGSAVNSLANSYPAHENQLIVAEGGRVISTSTVSVAYDAYGNTPMTLNKLLVTGTNAILDMGGTNIVVASGYAGVGGSSNSFEINGGLVTNVGAVSIASTWLNEVFKYSRLLITNGGRLYSSQASSIVLAGNSYNNTVEVYGSNSVWMLGGGNLAIGTATGGTNNTLTIDQGGTVDAIGTLTVATTNRVFLKSGLLGALAMTDNSLSLFTVGTGASSATLKALGGTLLFNSGLTINTNATLTGVGTVSGGSVGVTLTNGAILSPGLASAGTVTIGGSNLTWAGGGIYSCEITNLTLGFGVGWDVVNVSSQLVFTGTTPKFIKMDSKGVASGFNPALNYTLKILTYGGMTGYDTNRITVDTLAFSTVPASTWYVTNFNNSLYLAYDGTAPLGDASLVWKVPSNGNWNVGANWAGGVAPTAGGDPTNVLNFGDNGTRYYSTNNLTGTFQLNKLVLTSVSSVTNTICGSNLAFAVNGATAPRVDFQTGGGTFVVSNTVTLGAGMVFSGDAGGTLVLASNVIGGQPLVKQGPWTLALAGSNSFADPLLVTNVSIIRLDSVNAINTNSIMVSNGGNLVNAAAFTFGNGSYRSALVTGTDSLWTNGSLTLGTNAQILVDAGGRLAVSGALTVGDRGSMPNSLTVTNGGRIVTTGEFVVGTGNISNSALIATSGKVYAGGNIRVGNNAGGHQNSLVVRGTDALLDGGAQNLYVGYHGSASLYSNSITIADNAVVTNSMLQVGGGAYNNFNSLLITNGGKLFTKTAGTYVGNTGSSNIVSVIGGASAALWDNGGQQLTIGANNGSSNNLLLIDGYGAGALVTNVGLFQIGGVGAGGGNTVIVTNGGVLVYGSAGLDNNGVGYGGSSNTLAIAMGGKVYARGALTYVGEYAPAFSNVMSVRDPGSLFDAGGGKITIGAYNTSARSNLVVIDNYAVVSNCSVNVGGDVSATAYYPIWNRLVITNGARLYGVSGANNAIGGYANGSFNSATIYSNSIWNVTFGSLIVGQGTNNSLAIQDGGLVTNASSVYVGYWSGGARYNNLVITNGGKLYSTAVSGIGYPNLSGPIYGQSSNTVAVTGPNSLWDLGGANLTIGYIAAGSATGNVLTIDQGGTVDNIGTLTVNINSNLVNLAGGTLGLTAAIYSNGLSFTVGDGAQSATLKTLGGTNNFSSGLLINTNATLTGIGTVNGGLVGVTLTNGATLNPGLAGAGTLTISGSNLTWNAGATVVVDVVNLVGGAGSGYDTINVNTQLALVADAGSSSLVIRVTSLGVSAANFSSNASYNLLFASFSSITGFDATKFTVNADAFLNPVAGTWGVMRLDNNLYVTYRPTVEAGVDYTWAAPVSGNWTVNENWVGGYAPPASSPGMRLTFGGGASEPYYISANNNAGTFQMNQLVLTNANAAATNSLTGNPLQFWNADAAIDQGGSGSFNISIPLTSTTNLILRGAGSGMVLLTNTTVAGSLTKLGASTAVLTGTNSFIGPLVVNGAGGTLRVDNLNGISTNSLVVSNGTLSAPSVLTTFGNIAAYRSAQVTGSGSLWTNGVGLTIGSNAQVTVAGGARLAINGALTVADRGTVANSLLVTNGGQIFSTAISYIGNATSNNSVKVVGGRSVWNGGNNGGSVTLSIGSGVGATNNVFLVDGLGVAGGALVTNLSTMSVGIAAGSGWNTLIVTNGGQIFSAGPAIGNVSSNNTAILSGAGSLWNGGNGVLTVGQGVNAISNVLRIDGAGGVARMTNVAAVTVGITAGSGWNTLIVTNGGQLINAGTVIIGSASSNNSAVVSGGGALWNCSGNSLLIGAAGSLNNTFLIDGQNVDGGAVVTNLTTLNLSGDNTLMLVTNLGRVSAPGFAVGNAGRSNQMIFAQGGKMKGTAVANSYVGLNGGDANLLLIRDTNTIFDLGTAGSFVIVGGSSTISTGTGNVIRVENGGVLTNGFIKFGNSDAAHFDVGNVLLVTNGLIYTSGGASTLGNGANSCYSTALVVGASSVWNGGAQAIYVGWGGLALSNTLWVDAALVTNVAGFNIGQAIAQTNSGNLMVFTNGARVYANSATALGQSTYGTNNRVIVTGSGTLWDQGTTPLTLGRALTGSNNILRIDQGATVDNIGLLTINSNNFLQLRGGTLGVSTNTFTNGTMFTIGDGMQDATLKSLGGVLTFNSGLLLTNKNTLTGSGAVGGGDVGVILTNGATLAPGFSAAGMMTIAGSNLTWKGGAVYAVDITNLTLGAGIGWDLVTVNTQLLFTAGTPNYEIRLDSKGSVPVGFVPIMDYNIRIMTVGGTITGYDPLKITVTTNDFVGGTSPWVVSNVANSLYLVYRGAPAGSSASHTWMVPSNGNWDVTANWVGGTAPGSGGDPTNILGFGDNGTRYNSTNNLGAFQLNQLQLASSSGATNLIAGNPLIFTNNGATLPRVDFLTGGGAFNISNSMVLSTDTVFGGNAFVGGTVLLGGAVTNRGTLTKQGTWTLVLSNANNNFSGPVMVDSPDGILRVDNISALNGLGPVTVTNGMLWVNWPAASFYFSNGQNNRRGVVTRGAVWSNYCVVANNQSGFSLGASNVQFTVDGGKMYWTVRFHAFNTGASEGRVIVTNGGQLNISTYGAFVANTATNCTLTITGTNSLFSLGVNNSSLANSLAVCDGGGSGNVLRIDNGAVVTNISGLSVAGSAGGSQFGNSLILTNGSRMATSAGCIIAGLGSANNRFIVTGTNSLWYNVGANMQMLVGSSSGTNNSLLIDDRAVITNVRFSAYTGSGTNSLTVANGGKIFLTTGYSDAGTLSAGSFASSNSTTITGTGSVWNGMGMALALASGATNSWNRLTIEKGGMVTNFAVVNVASGVGAANNNLVVDGGILQATVLAFSNLFVNEFTITSNGQVTLNSYAVSNVNQRFNFNGGTLNVKNAWVSNGLAQVAGDGTQLATLNILPGGTNFFMDKLVITNAATLTGQGLIQATTLVYGVLSPGVAIGSLTNNGGLTLTNSSVSLFEIATNTVASSGWDLMVVTNGALTLGGTLKPVLTGGFLPTNTQSYVIMTNAGPLGISGEFVNGGNGASIPVYSNDLIKILGAFRLGISNQVVVLNGYLPNSELGRGSIFKVY